MLQPIATILASFAAVLASFAAVAVTAFFGYHQREIAREQARIAREKLRLDLYNRRFQVFTSIFDFYDAMIAWEGKPEQKEAQRRFFRAYQESGFLFAQESGIETLLKFLNDEGAKVIGFREHSDSFKSDPALMIDQINKTTDIQIRVFDEGLTRLRAAMHPYLDSSKVL